MTAAQPRPWSLPVDPDPAPARLPRRRQGRNGGDKRGNTVNRAARRQFLLDTFGDGDFAPCFRCGVMLDDETITVDRIIPGAEGGTYRRDNIRPACPRDNSETGGRLGAARRWRLDPAAPIA